MIYFLILFFTFFNTSLLATPSDSGTSKTLVTLKKVTKKMSPGRDWQELKRLAEAFPSSLSLSYLRSVHDLQRFQKVPRSHRYSEKYRRYYESAQAQFRFSSNRLRIFERELKEWEELVQLKLDTGLYSLERQEFYRKLLPAIKKNVSENIYKRGLETFHYFVENLSAPDHQGATFDDRFLKPKYAEEYRLRKIAFYENYKQKLNQQKQVALKNKNQNSVKNLNAKIKIVEEKISKWAKRSVYQDKRSSKRFLQDKIMGIDHLKELGYTGRHVLVGVLEPKVTSLNRAPHQDLKKRLNSQSDALTADHATHVSGIIGARARTIFDRVGTAPKANLLFLTVPPDRQPIILYQSKEGTTLRPSPKGPRTLVSSRPSARIDYEQAQLFRTALQAGVRIMNTSMVYSPGPQTLQALKEFARQGGVIVKAAGNSAVKIERQLTLRGQTLSPVQEYQIGTDIGLFKTVMADEDLKKAFIFVGNLKSSRELGDSSNKAGFLKERFLSAWGTDVLSTVGSQGRGHLTGTSMSAPIVAGSLALLQEAYPRCSTQVLAQNLLDSASKIGPQDIFGKGRLNVADAFELSAKSCGLPSPPKPKKKV